MRLTILLFLLLTNSFLLSIDKNYFVSQMLVTTEDFEIDGNPYKDIWNHLEWNYLKYSDSRIPGMAKVNPKKFKIAISKSYLYILFSAQNMGTSKIAKGDQDGFQELPQLGFWFKKENSLDEIYFVSVSTDGQATHANIKKEAFDFTWNPELTFKNKVVTGESFCEIKLKIDAIKFLIEDESVDMNFFIKENEGAFKKNRANDLSHFVWAPTFDFSTFSASSMSFGKAIKTKTPQSKSFPHLSLNEVALKKLAIDINEIKDGLKRKDVLFVPNVISKIEIDGKLDENSWSEFDKYNHVRPMNFFDPLFAYPPEINETYFKILADKDHIYVGFICHEANMKGLITTSDQLWEDDIVDFILDLHFGQSIFSDSYFILENNPIGVANKALGSQNRWKPESYNVQYTHEKDKWIVEFKISWQDLGLKTGEIPLISGANFLRFRANERGGYKDIAISNTEFSWVGNYVGDPHLPSNFGLLYFEGGNMISANVGKALGIKKDLSPKIKLQVIKAEEPKIEPLPQINRKAKLSDSKIVLDEKGQANIEFTLSGEIDVTVNILNDAGQVICHLGSGVVGENSPLPFQKGLKQKLVWDFTNDFGQKIAKDAAYSVEIKLGMDLIFDKILIGDPHKLSSVMGMCLDKEGNLIVLKETKGHGHYRSYNIVTYEKSGKFKKEILPPSSTLEYEKVKGISPIQLPNNKWMPVMYKPMLHAFIPQLPALKKQMPIISKNGEIYLVNSIVEVLMNFPHRIIKIGLDGSVKNDYLGPIVSENFLGGIPALGFSPDEKNIYLTGLAGKSRWGGMPHQAIYKISLDTKDNYDWKSEFRKPFIGELFVSGTGEKLDNPRDLTIAKNGDIIVADQNNNRVAIFNPEGKLKNEFVCQQPFGVEYSDRYQCYYVFRDTKDGRQIVKFNQLGAFVCAIDLPAMYKNAPSFFCMDDRESKVLIHYMHSNNRIKQLVDTGFNLIEKGDLISLNVSSNESLDRTNNFDSFEVSHDGKKIFLTEISDWGYGKNYTVYDSQNGRPLPFDKIYQWGADGNLYSKDHGRTESIFRFNAKFEPMPFKSSKSIDAMRGLPFSVDKDGNLYIPFTQGVKKFNRDGELETDAFIKVSLPSKTGASVSSFAQDKEGEFYILSPIKPKNEIIPDFFQNKLPQDKEVFPGPEMAYSFYYSSILKFKASGGSSCDDASGSLVEGRGYDGVYPVKINGMIWNHFGVSPYNYRTTNHERCVCEHGKFHKDSGDLFYYTDAMRYSIVIMDKNQNIIKRIGEYANNDSYLPNSNEPKVGFAWPTCIKTNDEACFVSDKVNRRVLRLRYTYQDEVKLPLGKK